MLAYPHFSHTEAQDVVLGHTACAAQLGLIPVFWLAMPKLSSVPPSIRRMYVWLQMPPTCAYK